MDKKTATTILNIIRTVVSIILCVAIAGLMLGATLIGVGRDYLASDFFKAQIETTDLSNVKFAVGGEKVTVKDYLLESAKDFIEGQNRFFFSFANDAIEKILSSQLVDNAVKDEVLYLVDFFLNSDAKEAKARIENKTDVSEVLELNPRNADTPENAIRIYLRSFVITNIEKASEMTTDDFIVFLSQGTVTKLIVIAVLLLILVIIINSKAILNNLLYGGIIGMICGSVIKTAQAKFIEINLGSEDLVGYVFLKPLADEYSSNATIGFVAGTILVILFIISMVMFSNKKDQEKAK